jgi:hypothetical protein
MRWIETFGSEAALHAQEAVEKFLGLPDLEPRNPR